ncbi:MAG: hypothetical protein M1457_14280, partial [bacterium]|nr:hypothetical protein [bacterium]
LLADAELLADPAPVDLREMSKFDELPNVAGLAAHRLESPCPGGDASVAEPLNMSLDRLVGHAAEAAASPEPDLPAEARKLLTRAFRREPNLVIDGRLPAGRGAGAPDAVAIGVGAGVWLRAIFPQSHAWLAAAVQRLLGCAADFAGDAAPGPLYTLLMHPAPLPDMRGGAAPDRFVGHWPARVDAATDAEPGCGFGLVTGFDDPRLAAWLLLDAARRHWSAPPRPRLVMAETISGLSEPHVAGAGRGERDAAGPKGDATTALWRDPLLPAPVLASRSGWRRAALSVGSLALGVPVDENGRFPHFMPRERPAAAFAPGADGGCFVVPRTALAGAD